MTDNVRVTTLENGLRVASDTMDRVESVSAGVWVEAGARHETKAQNGLAHFLEHMSFKGTPTRSAVEIARSIEAVGGSINAYTGYETTAYHVRMLSEDWPLGLEIIADVLTDSVFDPNDVEVERSVILQEIRRNNDTPDSKVFDVFQQAAYPNQSIGRPILGTMDRVSSFGSDDFRTFVGRHYRPERMIVAASGAVNHDRLVAQAEQLFGGWESSSASGKSAPGHYQGGCVLEQEDSDQVHVVFGFPAPAHGDDQRYAAAMLAMVLGGGMASRLFQKVREEHGLAYAVSAHHNPFQDTGLMEVYAGTSVENLPRLLGLANQEWRRLADDLHEEELERVRKQYRAGLTMAEESCSSRLRRLVGHLMIYGRPLTKAEMQERIQSVTGQQVRALSEEIRAQPFTMAAIGPVDAGAEHTLAETITGDGPNAS